MDGRTDRRKKWNIEVGTPSKNLSAKHECKPNIHTKERDIDSTTVTLQSRLEPLSYT